MQNKKMILMIAINDKNKTNLQFTILLKCALFKKLAHFNEEFKTEYNEDYLRRDLKM